MKKILFLIFPIVFFLPSCEEIVEGETLPYEEKLVVRGIFTPHFNSETMSGIKVTRTLPVLEDYTPEKAEVKNAAVFIEVDGVKYQCFYNELPEIENSYYWLEDGYSVIQPGKTYKLTVNWNGKTAFSQMSIPMTPEIVSIKIDSVRRRYYSGYEKWVKVAKAQVKPRENESYTLTFEIRHKNTPILSFSSYRFGEVKRFNEINKNGLVEVVSDYEYNTWSGNIDPRAYEVIVYVHAFDSQFAEYFKTRYNNYTDVTFSEPTKVKWNVFGNAIGMFTGYSTAVDTLEF